MILWATSLSNAVVLFSLRIFNLKRLQVQETCVIFAIKTSIRKMKVIKKILTILILIGNVLIRRKHYTLKFVAEHDGELKRWYYYFPLWGFEHGNLEMVAGADSLCNLYADDKDEAIVDIYVSKKPCNTYSYMLYDHYIGGNMLPMDFNQGIIKAILDRYGYGRTYKHEDNKQIFWICPVTLFVLGRYPNHIYIKK